MEHMSLLENWALPARTESKEEPALPEPTKLRVDEFKAPECLGMQYFNEATCQNLDIESMSARAAQIGACVMCDMCKKRLVTQAFEDKLTGLSNLNALSLQLEKYLQEKTPILLIFMDLRNFKAVNDSVGFQQGNNLLIAAAQTIENVVRESDHVSAATGRPGGDELVVLMQLTKQHTDDAGRIITLPMPPEEIPHLEVDIARRIIREHNHMDAFAAYNEAQGLSGEDRLGMRVGTTVIFPSEETPLDQPVELDKFMDRADPKTNYFAWNDLALGY